MANLFRATGHAIALCIALLYILAGQAHFTSRLTPGLAAHVDEMTPRSHQAFWFLNLSYTQVGITLTCFKMFAKAKSDQATVWHV